MKHTIVSFSYSCIKILQDNYDTLLHEISKYEFASNKLLDENYKIKQVKN